MKNKLFIALWVVLVGVFLVDIFSTPKNVLGSVSSDSGYSATTTGSQLLGLSGVKTVRTGPGMLGSVVITGANTGTAYFYNATTSNISQRTGNKATSSILIAAFPASTAVGTYTFDVNFTDGLLFVETGTFATSTITSK